MISTLDLMRLSLSIGYIILYFNIPKKYTLLKIFMMPGLIYAFVFLFIMTMLILWYIIDPSAFKDC